MSSYGILFSRSRFIKKLNGSARLDLSNGIRVRFVALAIASFTIVLIGCGAGSSVESSSGSLQISPSTVNFGSVGVGQTAQNSVLISNKSATSVAISQINVSGQAFSISSTEKAPINIPAGGTYPLSVGFAPASSVNYSGLITMMDSNSKLIAQLSMSGSGLIDGHLSASTTSLNFGNVAVNSVQMQTVTLTSTGTTAVTINLAAVSGTGFTLLDGNYPVTLNPTQTLTLHVQFDPTTSGAAIGQLSISSDSASGSTTVVGLSGSGIATDPPVNPQLTVNPASLSFGSVTVNTATTRSLTLTSTGTSPVIVNSTSITGAGFSIVAQSIPVTLDPSQSVTLQIQFDPTATGSVNGQVTISSNSITGGIASVALSGIGAAASPQLTISSGSLSFGNVTVSSATRQSLTLTSTGASPVTVNSVAITGDGFSVIGGSFPITLNPSQSMSLQVQFSPAATGAVGGQMTISSNSTNGSTAFIALSGTGTTVAHAVDLSWDAPASSSDPVAGYNIYRSVASGSFGLINLSLDPATVYVDNAVVSGTSYNYVVKSVDSSGVESIASNQITVTIP